MKAVFGMLLFGGGAVLMFGLFSGKITFGSPGSSPTAGLPNKVTQPPQKKDKAGTPLPTPYQTDQNKTDCLKGGGIWYNGKCNHFVGGSQTGK